jgi:archaetidylinositol phosphate synthase
MVLNRFREFADKLTKSQVKFFVHIGIKPNTLSIIGLAFGICAAVTFALPEIFMNSKIWSWIPPLLYFLSGYLDLIDGSVARITGTSSKFGGFLDSTLDRIGDAAAIVGIMIGNLLWVGDVRIGYLIGFISICITILISYTRSRAENEGVIMKGVGLMERGERFFALLGGIILETILRGTIPRYNHLFFPIFYCVYVFSCIFTVMQRIIHSYKWLTGNISSKYLKKHNITLDEE